MCDQQTVIDKAKAALPTYALSSHTLCLNGLFSITKRGTQHHDLRVTASGILVRRTDVIEQIVETDRDIGDRRPVDVGLIQVPKCLSLPVVVPETVTMPGRHTPSSLFWRHAANTPGSNVLRVHVDWNQAESIAWTLSPG